MALGVGRKELVMVGVLLAGTLLAVLNLTMLSPALPAIMADLGVGIRAGGGRGHPAFGLSGGAFHHAPAVRYVAFGIYRGQPVCGYRAELLGAFARPHHAGGLHGRGHAHGVHGDSARVPPREARYGHGRHRAHHRLRPGGGAVAVGPFG